MFPTPYSIMTRVTAGKTTVPHCDHSAFKTEYTDWLGKTGSENIELFQYFISVCINFVNSSDSLDILLLEMRREKNVKLRFSFA